MSTKEYINSHGLIFNPKTMKNNIDLQKPKEKFIKLKLNETEVVLTKTFNGIEPEILEFLKEKNPKKIVFLDTPPMQGAITAIDQIREILPETEIEWIDHHDIENPSNPRDNEIAQTAESIREKIGNTAVIKTRKEYPAISLLLNEGEHNSSSTVVIADNDLDGFFGALKATGITFPEIDQDASTLDGPRSMQNSETLSEKSWLLVRAMSTIPTFNPKAPEISIEAKAKLFKSFAEMLQGNLESQKDLESKVSEYEKQVETAKELLKNIETIGPNTLLVDVTNAEDFNLAVIAEHMEKSAKIGIIKKSIGPIASNHGGVQYSIAVSKKDQEGFDIRQFLPEGFVSDIQTGIIANTPFMMHVSEDVWINYVLPQLKVANIEIFNEEVFNNIKKELKITIPFQIKKIITKDSVGFKLTTPLKQTYYWHEGKVRNTDLDTTWDFVSTEEIDENTGKKGWNINENPNQSAIFQAQCLEYGDTNFTQEETILVEVVSNILGIDSTTQRKLYPESDIQLEIEMAKDKYNIE